MNTPEEVLRRFREWLNLNCEGMNRDDYQEVLDGIAEEISGREIGLYDEEEDG